MKLEVFFDYACPFCYAGIMYLKDILPEYPMLEIIWSPVEAHLREEAATPITPNYAKWWETKLQATHTLPQPIKVPYNPTPFGDRAIFGMYFVEENGGDIWKYHHNVYEAMFQKALNIEETDVLLTCLDDVGVNKEEFVKALDNPNYHQRLKDTNQRVYGDLGVEYIPAFLYAEERLQAIGSKGITREQLMALLKDW